MIDGKWTVGSNVPWDNKEFLVLLMETGVPVIIPVCGCGFFVGTVVNVEEICIEVLPIGSDTKDLIEVYLDQIDEHIYVASELKQYKRGKKK